jgi:hypothetical protein
MITRRSPAPQASLDYCAVRDRTVYSSPPGICREPPSLAVSGLLVGGGPEPRHRLPSRRYRHARSHRVSRPAARPALPVGRGNRRTTIGSDSPSPPPASRSGWTHPYTQFRVELRGKHPTAAGACPGHLWPAVGRLTQQGSDRLKPAPEAHMVVRHTGHGAATRGGPA